MGACHKKSVGFPLAQSEIILSSNKYNNEWWTIDSLSIMIISW